MGSVIGGVVTELAVVGRSSESVAESVPPLTSVALLSLLLLLAPDSVAPPLLLASLLVLSPLSQARVSVARRARASLCMGHDDIRGAWAGARERWRGLGAVAELRVARVSDPRWP